MTPLGIFPLTVNTAFNINVQQRGGVVELLNYAPYDISLQGPFGQTTLSGGSRVGYANPQYGMQIVGIPSAPGVTLNTSQINLVANWYDASELQPYPPTSIGNIIQNIPQGGGQSSIFVDTQNASGGATLTYTALTIGQGVYLTGFDVSGDKSAAVNTGLITIQGLINPFTGNGYNDLKFYINQGPNGTTIINERFPVVLQTAKTTNAANAQLKILTPNLAAAVFLVVYYQIF